MFVSMLQRKNNGWCPLGEPIKVIENQTEVSIGHSTVIVK